MKHCRRCQAEKPLSEFRRDPRYRDGYGSWCKSCHRERSSEWAKENRARVTIKAAEWRAANPEKAREVSTAYHRRNVTKRAQLHAAWAKANSDKRTASTAKRNAAKKNATPPWADLDAIAAIYAEAKRIQQETGVRMHVDHIIPLQHDLVCGLHCEGNLQILPGSVNESKNNKWVPLDAQRQGDFFVESAA